MKIPRKKFDEVSFQLAPMIDMTFLLLIFFMVTTRISKEQKKVDIKLPGGEQREVPPNQNDRDTISIDAAGTFFIGNNPATRLSSPPISSNASSTIHRCASTCGPMPPRREEDQGSDEDRRRGRRAERDLW
jgi:hypothetical protein